MKVFISWSGERSKYVALALKQFISDIIQSSQPWVSHVDITAGSRWNNDVQTALDQAKYGIICLTQENLAEPWIHFETGALAKSLDESLVCPFLIDLSNSDIPSGPLTQFQAKKADKPGVWDIMVAINKLAKENNLSEGSLERYFNKWWPDFEQKMATLPEYDNSLTKKRPPDEILDEILSSVREINRQIKVTSKPKAQYASPYDIADYNEDLRDTILNAIYNLVTNGVRVIYLPQILSNIQGSYNPSYVISELHKMKDDGLLNWSGELEKGNVKIDFSNVFPQNA